jgi:hypothetical protein
MIVAADQVEIYFALGFRLIDEPGCGIARLSVCVNRVPKKKTAQAGKPKAVKSELHNAGHTRRAGAAQRI